MEWQNIFFNLWCNLYIFNESMNKVLKICQFDNYAGVYTITLKF